RTNPRMQSRLNENDLLPPLQWPARREAMLQLLLKRYERMPGLSCRVASGME
ncbi:hypothetical protein TNCT_541201, partial [Trichonephila clavata]